MKVEAIYMDIKLLKKLREETGAGMLECKLALEAHQDDYEKALSYLKSSIKVEETNTRVASKGMCKIEVKGNQAILFEVNAETDFVSKNEHFINLLNQLGSVLIDEHAHNVNTALKVKINDKTIEELIAYTSAIIKENAYLRRFYRVEKNDNQGFGSYTHNQGKLVSLVITDKSDEKTAYELAMQVAAMSAEYISLSHIDLDTMNYEKFMYEKNHGSFDELDFNKALEGKTLLSQPWIKDNSITVEDYLAIKDIKVIDFFKFELGQGIDNKLNCRLDIPCDGSKITVMPIY